MNRRKSCTEVQQVHEFRRIGLVTCRSTLELVINVLRDEIDCYEIMITKWKSTLFDESWLGSIGMKNGVKRAWFGLELVTLDERGCYGNE